MPIQADIVSRAVADGNLINAVTSPDSESKTPESESADEEMVTEKISWTESTNAYSSLLQLTKPNAGRVASHRRECSYIFCIPLFGINEKNAQSKQKFSRLSRKLVNPTRISSRSQGKGGGFLSPRHGASSGCGWRNALQY